jgi:hypothetical protein
MFKTCLQTKSREIWAAHDLWAEPAYMIAGIAAKSPMLMSGGATGASDEDIHSRG